MLAAASLRTSSPKTPARRAYPKPELEQELDLDAVRVGAGRDR